MLAVLSVERGPGAEACMDDAQLTRSVERRLKRRVFVTDAEANLRLRIRFVAREAEIEARIELSSIDGASRGTRSLVATGHCSVLDDSLALSVALLVDQPPDPLPAEPGAPASEPAGSSATTGKSPSGAEQSPASVITIPPEVAAAREPWHLRAGAAAKAAWGPLPGVRPAVVLALTLVPRSFVPIRLQGEAFWPAKVERDARSGARFHLLRVGLSLCPPLWDGARVSLGLCAGQQLGWLQADGYGFDRDSKEQRLGYSLTLGGEGRLRLFPPVSVRGYLGGEVPLIRDRFGTAGRNASQLFQPNILAITGEIGLEAALW